MDMQLKKASVEEEKMSFSHIASPTQYEWNIEREQLSSIWQHTRCKCSQHNQTKNALQIVKKHLQIKKTTFVNLTTHAANAHNTTKQRSALQIQFIWLWVFTVWDYKLYLNV